MWTSNFVKSCTVAVESIKQQVAFFFRLFNNSMKNKIDHRLCLRSVAIELYYVMWNTWSDMVYVLPACMFFLPCTRYLQQQKNDRTRYQNAREIHDNNQLYPPQHIHHTRSCFVSHSCVYVSFANQQDVFRPTIWLVPTCLFQLRPVMMHAIRW